MKVLVATRPAPTGGGTAVWSAARGEIVVAPFVCEDRGCVCDHVHQGIVSHEYTSEAQVQDVDTAAAALVKACHSHLEFSQWAGVVDHASELELLASDLIADATDVADRFAVGTVLRMAFDHGASMWRYTAVEPS